MTYIYNLTLNFKKEFFDFFEWNSNDKITYIKKIPLIKVTNTDFSLFKNSTICFEKEFKNQLFNKTEKLYEKEKNIKYACVITNGYESMALKLNKKGINYYKSSLLLEQEEKVTSITFKMKETKPKYIILKNYNPTFKTRKEKELENFTINTINKMYINKENEKLKFLYFDCFNIKEKNIKKIYTNLKKEIVNNSKNIEKINNFCKILQQNRG